MGAASTSVQELGKALQRDLEPRQKAVNNAVRDFLGGTEIRKAEEFAQAIQKIGGVSKLTEADQQKVNRAVNQALDHYRALGTQAPDHLKKLEAETRKVGTSTGLLESQWVKMTAAFSAGMLLDRALTGLVSFGKSVIANAGNIADLSAKTGLSTRAVQVYGQVVKEAGGTVDDMANAVFKLGINAANGDKKFNDAIKALGMNLADVRKMNPEQLFEAMAGKLKDVESVQDRNRLGVDLFGKTWGNVAASVQSDITGIGDSLTILGDDQVKALDEASDAWDRLSANIGGKFGQALGQFALNVEREVKRIKGWLDVDQMIRSGDLFGAWDRFAEVQESVEHVAKRVDVALKSTTTSVHKLTEEEEDAQKATKKHSDEIDKLVSMLTKKDIAKELNDMATAIARVGADKVPAEEVARLTKRWNELTEAGVVLPPILSKMQVEQNFLNATMEESARFASAAAKGITNYFRAIDVGSAQSDIFGKDGFFSHQGTQKFDITIGPVWDDMFGKNGFFSSAGTSTAVKAAGEFQKAWSQSLSTTAQGFAQFAQIAGDSMSDTMRSIGQMTSLLDLASKGGSDISKGFDQITAKGASGAQIVAGFATAISGAATAWGTLMEATSTTSRGRNIMGGAAAGASIGTSILPGWGTAIGAGVGAIVGALRDGHNATRKEIEAWVEDTVGGFDEMQKLLIAMDREDLWVNLTQGSAETNVRAVKEISALNKMMEKYGLSLKDLQTPQQNFDDALKVIAKDFEDLKHMGFGDKAITKGAAEGLNNLVRAALDAGGKLPASLQPYLHELANAGLVADDVTRRLLGMPAQVVAPWQQMQSIAEEFGIDLAALGVNFQQAKLGETAEEFAGKFMLLIDNGANATAVMGGMSGKANEFLANAKRWGIELPASMRPVLQQFLDAGQLIDDNGVALKSLEGVKFAESLADQMDPLLAKLDELIEALTKGVPGALAAMGNAKVPTIRVPVVYDVDDSSNRNTLGDDVGNSFKGGSGGLRYFNPSGSMAMLHGREEVLNEGQSMGVASMVRAALDGASGRGGGTVVVQVGTRELARMLMPEIAGEVRRYQLGSR
jgi:hypothetical protein